MKIVRPHRRNKPLLHIVKKLNKKTRKTILVASVLALVFGIGVGYLIASERNSESAVHTQDEHSHSGQSAHEMYMVSEEQAPSVDLIVEEDAKSGWNVTINTSNFSFAPENVNGENNVGEGHAHLYVDGEKVARLYSPYFHLDENFDGDREFRVTLNANDHSEYALNGEVIEAVKSVSHSH